MFKFFKKNKCRKNGNCNGPKRCCDNVKVKDTSNCISLDKAPESKRLIIHSNSDIKTMEIGLYPGAMVTLQHNDDNERNIVVKIHDQRYVIPRDIAEQIFVRK